MSLCPYVPTSLRPWLQSLRCLGDGRNLVPGEEHRVEADLAPVDGLVGEVGTAGMAGRAERDDPGRVVPVAEVERVAGDGRAVDVEVLTRERAGRLDGVAIAADR